MSLKEKSTLRWVQYFIMKKNLVSLKACGKLAVSPEKQERIDKSIAYHLGQLKRGFKNKELEEDGVQNADETHFVIHMHKERAIGLKGERNFRYADVTGGSEHITVMVRPTGGWDSKIEVPFAIFRNPSRSYPIRGVPDTVPSVCYRSGVRGWMDNRVFYEWLEEPRTIQKLSNGKKRILYVDNCSGHAKMKKIEKILVLINTELRKLPANSADKAQPADQFIISKIKGVFKRH